MQKAHRQRSIACTIYPPSSVDRGRHEHFCLQEVDRAEEPAAGRILPALREVAVAKRGAEVDEQERLLLV